MNKTEFYSLFLCSHHSRCRMRNNGNSIIDSVTPNYLRPFGCVLSRSCSLARRRDYVLVILRSMSVVSTRDSSFCPAPLRGVPKRSRSRRKNGRRKNSRITLSVRKLRTNSRQTVHATRGFALSLPLDIFSSLSCAVYEHENNNNSERQRYIRRPTAE